MFVRKEGESGGREWEESRKEERSGGERWSGGGYVEIEKRNEGRANGEKEEKEEKGRKDDHEYVLNYSKYLKYLVFVEKNQSKNMKAIM